MKPIINIFSSKYFLMWVWLAISMILVVACIIFGIYSFISSRTLQKSISSQPEFPNDKMRSGFIKHDMAVSEQQDVLNLKIKFKSIEENALKNTHFLSDIKKRIETLEAASHINQVNKETKWDDDSDEDWEKLYYEMRKEKQSLDDDLSDVKTALQENKDKLQEIEKQQAAWAAIKSDVESRTNEVQSLQNIIEELQRKLEGSRERERDLAEQVALEKARYSGYELLQHQNNQLRSEIEILTNTLEEIKNQNILMQQKIKGLIEPCNILEISEYEKISIRNSLEQLLHK